MSSQISLMSQIVAKHKICVMRVICKRKAIYEDYLKHVSKSELLH